VPAVPARYRPAGCSPVRMSGVAAWPVSQNLISDHPEVHIRRLHYLLNKSLLQSISALDTANPVLDRMHNGSVHFFCAPALADSLKEKSMRSVVDPESGRCCDKDMVQKATARRSTMTDREAPGRPTGASSPRSLLCNCIGPDRPERIARPRQTPDCYEGSTSDWGASLGADETASGTNFT
jgi:hypothetical protein